MTSRRAVIALGGNAMTGPDGSATPGAQRDAIREAAGAHRRRRRLRRRGRAHPRQRPPGGQPAGQERAGRARRPAGAAGLVRRPDPGDHRLHARRRARRRPRRPRPRPQRTAGLVTRTLVDADDPGFREPSQAGRPLPPARGGGAVRRPRPGLGGPRREGLAPGGRLARAALGRRRPPPSTRWPPPASSSSAPAAAASRSPTTARTTAHARCAASRPSSTRT